MKIDIKAVREKKGITLQQVFDDTKISKSVIEAIEANDFSSVYVNEVYLKGFAKTYARYLGLDPKEVVAQLFPEIESQQESNPKVQETVSPKPEHRASHADLKKIIAGIIAVIISLVARVLRFIVKNREALIYVFFAALFAVVIGFWLTRPVSVPKNAKQSAEPLENGAAVPPKEVAPAEPSPEKNDVQSPFRVTITAKDNCWLRVKVDGREIFRGTLKKGDVESWEGKQKIALWVGNAGAIAVDAAGKEYQNVGKPGQIIKDIVFYPDGSYKIER